MITNPWSEPMTTTAVDHHDLAADLLTGVDHDGTAPALRVSLALAHATLALVEAVTEAACSPTMAAVRLVDLGQPPRRPEPIGMDRP